MEVSRKRCVAAELYCTCYGMVRACIVCFVHLPCSIESDIYFSLALGRSTAFPSAGERGFLERHAFDARVRRLPGFLRLVHTLSPR